MNGFQIINLKGEFQPMKRTILGWKIIKCNNSFGIENIFFKNGAPFSNNLDNIKKWLAEYILKNTEIIYPILFRKTK